MSRLVLGAGPVGLLAAYLLRVPCVGEIFGGSVLLRRLAPSYLWESLALGRVLEDLGLSSEVEEVRFGFWTDSGVTSDPTPLERREYLRRSGRDPSRAPRSAVSSGTPGVLRCFRTSVEELTRALERALTVRSELLRARVTSIAPWILQRRVDVELDGVSKLPVSEVVNTLPAPVFDSLTPAKLERTWDAGPKWFLGAARAWADPVRDAASAGLRYLYVSNPRVPFDRVTFLPEGEGFVYEFNRDPAEVLAPGFCEDVFDTNFVGPLRLQVRGEPRSEVEYAGLVRHVGRFARWDHRIRLHDVAGVLS